MRAVIQLVSSASVDADGVRTGEIDKGFVVLLGVAPADTEIDAAALAAKISKLRIFPDEKGKMNLSLADVGGSVLVVSQFTLYANYSHGNRPDFLSSAPPDLANTLYESFIGHLKEAGIHTQCGVFGAHMRLSLLNEGPVTIIMDSEKLKKG